MKDDKIVLAHGSGGKLTQRLFQQIFQPQFNNPFLDEAHDGAILSIGGQQLAFSTDTFVVKPLFFPGGNIGDLAVNGTVNDIAMCGAIPLYLSAGFILEEGFPIETLKEITRTMSAAAKIARIELVTGDTKVVEKGGVDEVFINTAGIGRIHQGAHISPGNVTPGDVVIINGTIADHGIAVLSKREGMTFETEIQSDTVALNDLVTTVMNNAEAIRVLRDPSRGGLATALNEIAFASKLGFEIDEDQIPIGDQVAALSSLLGIDPLYVANEGKVIVVVAEDAADAVLQNMRSHPLGRNSTIIGHAVTSADSRVILNTRIGTRRILDLPLGDRLPRIC